MIWKHTKAYLKNLKPAKPTKLAQESRSASWSVRRARPGRAGRSVGGAGSEVPSLPFPIPYELSRHLRKVRVGGLCVSK